MANTFEQTVAALVENRMAAEHPNLEEYRRGFVLLDFDEEKQTAFGLYRFVVGTVPAIMPLVYSSGSLEGLDILILRDLPLFVPAIDGWISFVADSGVQELGELMPDKGRGKGPSTVTMDLKQFPHMLKTAEALLPSNEFRALKHAVAGDIDESALATAITRAPMVEWLESYPKGASLVAKAAASSPHVREILGERHGDKFVETITGIMHEACSEEFGILRKSAPIAPEAPPKVTLITDIGSPEAAGLRASEKRVLMRNGQFLLDKRSEAETTLVMRSPDSNVFQTCPGPGNWQLLLQDGDVMKIETCIPFNGGVDGYDDKHMDSQGRERIWVIPADGAKPFEHPRSQLYVRPSSKAIEAKPKVGDTASRSAMLKLLTRKRSDDDCTMPSDGMPVDRSDDYSSNNLLVVSGGRADNMYVSVPRPYTEKAPLMTSSKTLIFTDSPGRMKDLGDRLMIPSTARVFNTRGYGEVSVTPGRPSDIERKFAERNDVEELAVTLRGDLISLDGAVRKGACSQGMAMREMVMELGVGASVAATMLQDVKSRPGVEHRYLLKASAFSDDEDQALSSLNFSVPIQTKQHIDQSILAQGGQRVAKAVDGAEDDEIDDEIIDKVLSMSDFREITSDAVRKFTSAMDEAGKMLLRVLVHRDRYEDRYGEDVEKMETSLREAFQDNGALALYLREKRGRTGIGDDESALAGLLTEDMG